MTPRSPAPELSRPVEWELCQWLAAPDTDEEVAGIVEECAAEGRMALEWPAGGRRAKGGAKGGAAEYAGSPAVSSAGSPDRSRSPSRFSPAIEEFLQSGDATAIARESIVEEGRAGYRCSPPQMRQAGADRAGGDWSETFRQTAERDLYVFAVGVMKRRYLTTELHREVCDFLQTVPGHRKMVLMPRDHAKTSIVSHCLPLHIYIQPKESNIYFPGFSGQEHRILISGETQGRAEGNLRVIRTALEGSAILRALWPAAVWEAPRRQASKWSDSGLICPRENEYPDPTFYAIGVGGAITGSRPTVIIKDDLIALEARNSPTVMERAIEWHIASRALMDEFAKDTGVESLEYIIGTRWAVYDLYSYIQEHDESVELMHRCIVEEGRPVWPERFNDARIAQLKREFGAMFWLLYMNTAANADLVDFDIDAVREYRIEGGESADRAGRSSYSLVFSLDERDVALERAMQFSTASHEPVRVPFGTGLRDERAAAVLSAALKSRRANLRIGGRGRI